MSGAELWAKAKASLASLTARRAELVARANASRHKGTVVHQRALDLAAQGNDAEVEPLLEEVQRFGADYQWSKRVVEYLNVQIKTATLTEIQAHISERRETEKEVRAKGRAIIEEDRRKIAASVGFNPHAKLGGSKGYVYISQADAILSEIETLKDDLKQEAA